MQLFTSKHPKRKVLGRGSALSCFACFVPSAPQQRSPVNLLTGKPWDARSIPPVSRCAQLAGGLVDSATWLVMRLLHGELGWLPVSWD